MAALTLLFAGSTDIPIGATYSRDATVIQRMWRGKRVRASLFNNLRTIHLYIQVNFPLMRSIHIHGVYEETVTGIGRYGLYPLTRAILHPQISILGKRKRGY